MFTPENMNRLEWECSDEPDAPEIVSKALVRKLIHHHRNAVAYQATLSAANEQLANRIAATAKPLDNGRERIEFIRRAAIAYFASLDNTDLAETPPDVLEMVWKDSAALWNAKPEGL